MSKTAETLVEKYEAIANVLGKTPQEVEALFRTPEVGVQTLADLQILESGDVRNAIGCDDPDVTKRPGKAQWRQTMSIIGRKVVPTDDPTAPTDRLDALQKATGVELKVSIKDLSVEQLVPYFDPTNPSDRISRELKTRFNSIPVLVFDPGTKNLNVAQTIVAMKRIERGAEPLKIIMVNGSLVRPVAVGSTPDQFVDEDPLFPNQPLEDGVSVGNFIDWSKVPMNVRQFCRLLLETGVVNPRDEARIAELVKTIEHGLTALSSVYKSADLNFREREAEGTLPKLRIPQSGSRKNYPFGNRAS